MNRHGARMLRAVDGAIAKLIIRIEDAGAFGVSFTVKVLPWFRSPTLLPGSQLPAQRRGTISYLRELRTPQSRQPLNVNDIVARSSAVNNA